MVNRLISIIALNEGILRKGFGAVFAPFLQAQHTCETALFVVHDEHIVFLPHRKHCRSARSSPERVLVNE